VKAAREVVDAVLEGRAVQDRELEFDGRSVLMNARPLPSGGAVLVIHDLTDLRRLEAVRRDFVANVSHELKTPLAAIRGYAETLRDGALDEPPTARRFTERILNQCQRLQELLDDLLTLSRLEGLAPALERETVDLGAVVRHAVELLSPAAREKRVAIEVDALPVLPLLGDSDGIERLLLNLLDNAIKYNRAGGRVMVRLSQTDGEALLEVSDTGIGIPPESLPRIFERFYRVDKGRAREEGGTGLGLAIVKHVVTAAGGRVEATGARGEGLTVRCVFPVS
jgi:two-component system, OmpR family, phosphate regulon sensor histidine kinase PhoR